MIHRTVLDLIDRVAFSGENAFALERRADGWYLTAPFAYPLSDAAVNSLLGKLEGLRFAQYVSDEADADLAAYGLRPPRRTLTLDIAESVVTGYDEQNQPLAETRLPAYQLTFALGDSENDVIFYCLYRGEVVKATVFSAGFLLTQGYDERYQKISYENLKRGDLLCFDTVDDADLSDHVGIYLGSGYFIHASSVAKKVMLSSLSSGYYKRTFSWGRRIFNS